MNVEYVVSDLNGGRSKSIELENHEGKLLLSEVPYLYY